MGEQLLFWIICTAVSGAIGIIGYFLKRTIDRQDKVENDVNELNRTPDLDITEGMMRIVSHLLLTNIQRLSDEDFENVDPMKMLKQASDLIRVSAYKRGMDIKNKEISEVGFDAIKQKAFTGVAKKYPELYEKFSAALDELAAEASDNKGGDSS